MSKKTRERKILIETTFIVPLEELVMHILESEEDISLLLEYLHHKPSIVEEKLKKVIKRILRFQHSPVRLKELKFSYNDSENITHGVSYFKAMLRGTEKELKILGTKNDFTKFQWDKVKQKLKSV